MIDKSTHQTVMDAKLDHADITFRKGGMGVQAKFAYSATGMYRGSCKWDFEI